MFRDECAGVFKQQQISENKSKQRKYLKEKKTEIVCHTHRNERKSIKNLITCFLLN